MIRKPIVISNNEIHSGKKNLTSCLNKLTKENCSTIFRKILLAVQVNDMKDFIEQIMNTCLNSKVYHDLYVGLIIHLYTSDKSQISLCVSDLINLYFQSIFQIDYFKMNKDELDESYNDFCDRVSAKCKKIFTIKVFMMFHLFDKLSEKIEKKPQDIIDCMYEFLKESIQEGNKDCIELLLLCLKDCYSKRTDLSIPFFNGKVPIVWKKMIKIDFKLSELIREYISIGNPLPKIRFICIDLLALLDIYNASN